VVLAVCYLAQAVVITLLCSVLCAFLLEPVVAVLVRIRFPRALAAFLVCVLAAAALVMLGGVVVSRGAALVEEMPGYEAGIRDTLDRAWLRIQNMEAFVMRFMPRPRQQPAAQPKRGRASAPPPVPEVRLREEAGLVSRYVFPQLRSLYEVVLLASFVPFLIYFMLSWKEHMRRGFVNLFEGDNRVVAQRTLDGIGTMVRGFVVGNFLIAVLLASLSALIFWFLRLPAPFLMGTASGLLSVIPYLGLPLAMAPPLLAAIGAHSSFSSYVVIVLVVVGLHLVALDLLYPKLVGSWVHLNPLAVIVAIMVWGWMWGAIGLLLAVPITAGLKAVCDNVPSLAGWGRLLGE
jgi:predicted PurR-regulated permease PerM